MIKIGWPRYIGKARLKKHRCNCCGTQFTNEGEQGDVLQYKSGELTIRFGGFTYAWPASAETIEMVDGSAVPVPPDPNDGNDAP